MGDDKQLITVVSVDLVRPLEAEWEQVGPVLHRIRNVAHRCLNASIRRCALIETTGEKVAFATATYRTVGELLKKEQEYCPDLSVSSAIQVAWSKSAADKYVSMRKAMWKGEMSLPSYKRGAPIMLAVANWDFERDDKGYRLRVKLMAGRAPWNVFAAVAEGGGAHGQLRMLLSGEATRGDLKIVYDERRKRWTARLTLKRPMPVPLPLDPTRVLSVHRGMRSFITWATSEGATDILDGGEQVLAFKDQMHRRRRGWYAHKKSASKRTHGRGYFRRYQMYRELEDKEANFVDTKCKQLAARVVSLAVKHGCGKVIIDDWSASELGDAVEAKDGAYKAWLVRRWPFAQQKQAIEQALLKIGLVLEVVPSAYESQTCPSCGHVDAKSDGGRGTFCCTACGFKRHVDSVANLNALRQAGFFDVLAKQKKALEPFLTVARTG
jgi:hypothetical protein